MFETGQGKVVEPNKLPGGNHDNNTEPKSLEDALRMQYEGNGE